MGTVRVYDARCGDSRAVASFRAPAGERDVCSATLGGGATGSMIAAAVGPHVVFFDRRRQGADASHADMFRDAHSEAVTRARYRGSARFALVGGINTFLALSLQSGLQAAFQAGSLPLETQFQLLAALLVLLGAVFALDALGRLTSLLLACCGCCRDEPEAAAADSGGTDTPPRYQAFDDGDSARYDNNARCNNNNNNNNAR